MNHVYYYQMRVRFADKKLEQLYLEDKGSEQYPEQVVNAFLRAIQFFMSIDNETQLYQLKGLHVEKLSGKRKGQYSLRLNKQFRLVYRLEKVVEEVVTKETKERTDKKQAINTVTVVVVLELVDYH